MEVTKTTTTKEIERIVKEMKAVETITISFTKEQGMAIANKLNKITWYSTKESDLLCNLYGMFLNGSVDGLATLMGFPKDKVGPSNWEEVKEGDTVTLKNDIESSIEEKRAMSGKSAGIRLKDTDGTFKISGCDWWFDSKDIQF